MCFLLLLMVKTTLSKLKKGSSVVAVLSADDTELSIKSFAIPTAVVNLLHQEHEKLEPN